MLKQNWAYNAFLNTPQLSCFICGRSSEILMKFFNRGTPCFRLFLCGICWAPQADTIIAWHFEFQSWMLRLFFCDTGEIGTLCNRIRFLRFCKQPKLEGYLTSRAELQNRNLRNQGTLVVPQSKTSSRRKTFQIASASDWNSLAAELRKTTSIGSFNLKQLRDSDISNHKCTL